jgi:spermidine synthase
MAARHRRARDTMRRTHSPQGPVARIAGEASISTAMGRRELLVAGVVQSIDAEHAESSDYWPAMLPDRRPARALLLGAGGGTLAALLHRRFGPVPLVAVDNDPDMVALGRRAFYLGLPGVQPVIADAFAFAATCPGRFDYVAVDLFHGAERPRQVGGRPFLGELARLAAPRGVVAFNLFRDRRVETTIMRIARMLPLARRTDVGKNVVLHCRGR